MSEELKEISVAAFADLTVSNAPTPGDGPVSALFGSLSVALTGMVTGLTVGKKKHVEVEAEMREVAAAAEALKKELVEEIDRDSDSFNEFMAAMALPRDTDEEKAARKATMQNGLEFTAKVPCHVIETVARIFSFAKMVVECGNVNAMTDGFVVAMAAGTAVTGVDLSMKINLASIEDEDFVAECSAHVAALEEQVITVEREIFAPSKLIREI